MQEWGGKNKIWGFFGAKIVGQIFWGQKSFLVNATEKYSCGLGQNFSKSNSIL